MSKIGNLFLKADAETRAYWKQEFEVGRLNSFYD